MPKPNRMPGQTGRSPRRTAMTSELPDFHHAPGHLFRRARQVHDALWAASVSASMTPLQYAVLTALEMEPGIDQRRLGQIVALDKSTVGDLVVRLAKRGFLIRSADLRDRRRTVLTLTREGRAALHVTVPRVQALGNAMLSVLTVAEAHELLRLLDKFVYSDLALDALGGRYGSAPEKALHGDTVRIRNI
jgi:DNA-binding MarR family transcriptional regulator